MRQLTIDGCTYTLHDGVDLDDLWTWPPDSIAGLTVQDVAPPLSGDDQPRFPKGANPGDRISFDYGNREGVVLDRAPNGGDKGRVSAVHGCRTNPDERSGYWLWVLPDDADLPVRVRYYSRGYRKGEAYVDDGPMVVHTLTRGTVLVTADELQAEGR